MGLAFKEELLTENGDITLPGFPKALLLAAAWAMLGKQPSISDAQTIGSSL
jgi:hypothetical protein